MLEENQVVGRGSVVALNHWNTRGVALREKGRGGEWHCERSGCEKRGLEVPVRLQSSASSQPQLHNTTASHNLGTAMQAAMITYITQMPATTQEQPLCVLSFDLHLSPHGCSRFAMIFIPEASATSNSRIHVHHKCLIICFLS